MSAFRTNTFTVANDILAGFEEGFEYYFVQPALKYNQLKKGERILLTESNAFVANHEVRDFLADKLEKYVFGDMTETTILYETSKALQDSPFRVCKPYFRGDIHGEMDMIVFSMRERRYYAFEIKHTSNPFVKENQHGKPIGQDKHLLNPRLHEILEDRYGQLERNCVLYNGESMMAYDGTAYLNIHNFLTHIYQSKDIEKTMSELAENCQEKRKVFLRNK